jgi:hypothetical protein
MQDLRFFVRLSVAGLALGTAGFGAGLEVAERQARHEMARQSARLDDLQQDVWRLAVRTGSEVAGTSGVAARIEEAAAVETALVEAVSLRLQRDLGLVSPKLLRARRASFVELYATDASGGTSYGTAGYLGHDHFITVKHGVVRIGEPPAAARRFESIRLRIEDGLVEADLVDAGDAEEEVHPGDWAIVKARAPVRLPALRVNLDYDYPFADPIVRLGNDYSRGIIASSGYVGTQEAGLITCLTDGHPGVSGGGVLNAHGDLVGIPIGRMQGDYRFSFILPLRAEMFRRVPSSKGAHSMADN